MSPSPLLLDMAAKPETTSIPLNMAERNGSTAEEQTATTVGSGTLKTEDRGHPERKRRASNESLDVSYQCWIDIKPIVPKITLTGSYQL